LHIFSSANVISVLSRFCLFIICRFNARLLSIVFKICIVFFTFISCVSGWIKEELYIDFKFSECRSREDAKSILEDYIKYYNEQRPCYALGYDTPSNYRKRYYKGEIEHKNTFEKRELSEVPKFVQKRSK